MPRSKTVLEGPAAVEQLEQLLAATNFDASSRGRALLRFLLGEMVAHRQESLTLATIARRVFRRGEDFDSLLDPAVPIEIARVRRALDRYYSLQGATDPVRISLPKGGFVPEVRRVTRTPSPLRARAGEARPRT